MLQIDELQGTKPTESIDLSRKGLKVASAIIIASCIKENSVLKELKYAAISNQAIECSLLCQRPLTEKRTLSVPAVSSATSSDPKVELRSLRA